MISGASKKQRNISIDSLRGLAVVLMVAGHVVGSTGDTGMRVADESAWRWVYLMLEDVRMPLFTVLSGYVYAMRPLRQSSGYGRMLKGKARRLLVPLLLVGTFFYMSQAFLPGTNNAPPISEVWRVYLYGYGHFWFLLALFLIFMLVPAIDAFGGLRTPTRWAVVLGLAAVAFIVLPYRPSGGDFLASFGALRLLPFFLLGYGLNIHAKVLHNRVLLLGAVMVIVGGLYLKVGFVNNQADHYALWSKSVAVLLGLSVLFTLLWFKDLVQVPWLAWLGQRSFGIYLLHVFGTAGARILVERIGWDSPGVIFTTSLIAGVLLPVAFEMLFGRFRIISWGVLGQKPRAAGSPVRIPQH